ncbi:MAG: translation initiation factor IF-2 subunit alpha [Candidatus Bathyarchaeota archaeon]|nr:MAG: translation initiation factor IF-2 subunit alpha [Candidatus Bathyarchaeota archaeon]
MSVLRKSEWPEKGELVLATVDKVTNYGAYVTLEEYASKEGFLHRGEISTSWIRNIRHHVREGQKLVLRVLRVNPEKRHIDLSRKRVNRRERIEKIQAFKHERKAETFLHHVAEVLKKPIDEILEKAVVPMEETYGSIYEGLEEASRRGSEVLAKIGVPTDLAEALTEIAKERIQPSQVEVRGTLNLVSGTSDGVNVIRDALKAAQDTPLADGESIRVYTTTPPNYCLAVQAEDYKQAEALMQKASTRALKKLAKSGGKGDFTRER